MRRLILAIAVVAVGLVAAPLARGEVRSLAVNDAQDARPTLSGVPNNPDIRNFFATYDSVTGTVTLTVEFYNALNALDTSQNYAMWSSFDIGEGSPEYGDPWSCSAYGGAATIAGQHDLIGDFYDRATVGGFDGYLNFARTESPDRRTVTVTATSPALVNRNYRCVEYSVRARTVSSVSNLDSEYDFGCDCWYVPVRLDSINETEIASTTFESGVWFTGFMPPPPPPPGPPPPPPPPALRQATLAISAGGGCRRVIVGSWDVGPSAGGAPATGMIRVRVGRRVTEFRATRKNPVRLDGVKPGTRTLHALYEGDERRTAATAAVSVRVKKRSACRQR